MNRISQFFLILALTLLFPTRHASAQMFFPVIHPEPITVRIVDAQDGRPRAHLHVALVAGYDRNDVERHLWREEAVTDENGEIRLPGTLLNLPWLGVLMPKWNTCKSDPRIQAFSVERMRNDGFSAPNRCGTVTAIQQPGLLTVFAQDRKTGHKESVGSGVASALGVLPSSEDKAR